MLDRKLDSAKFGLQNFNELINHVDDRPGHDKRYAIDANKIITQLNWKPRYDFESSIESTIDWYIENYER